jgi:hypothetical protein
LINSKSILHFSGQKFVEKKHRPVEAHATSVGQYPFLFKLAVLQKYDCYHG